MKSRDAWYRRTSGKAHLFGDAGGPCCGKALKRWGERLPAYPAPPDACLACKKRAAYIEWLNRGPERHWGVDDDGQPWVDLIHVFSYEHAFGDSCLESIFRVVMMVAYGAVGVTRIVLPTSRYRGDDHTFSGNTDAHRLICGRIATWLEDNCVRWSASVPEIHYPGGMCDVAAPDVGLFCEAGYTQSLKISKCLLSGRRVMVVPYFDNDDEAFLFAPSDTEMLGRFKEADMNAMHEAASKIRMPKRKPR